MATYWLTSDPMNGGYQIKREENGITTGSFKTNNVSADNLAELRNRSHEAMGPSVQVTEAEFEAARAYGEAYSAALREAARRAREM